MAARAERIAALVAELEPRVAKAFLDSIADIRGAAQLALIEDALRRGDIEAAVRAVSMARGFFAPLDSALTGSWIAGGQAAVAAFPVIAQAGARLAIRFDGRNPRAEQWIAEQSSRLVTEITEDTRDGIRAYATNGMVDGRNPKSTALDIVGRINRVTGRREGGLVGLTSGQMRYVENARAELNDPDRMADYLIRKRRDRRFDRTVAKAMREGKPLTSAEINRIVGRYSDRMLALRGETIARTETLQALNAARMEATEQLLETGAVTEAQITKVWRSASDGRVRDSHAALNGTEAGLRETFTSPITGARMLHPGDTSKGAPGEEIINCRCWWEPKIDYLAAFRAA